ncbi:MAG: stalk domain-containing protein [Bacillota bacterium]
MKKNAAGKSLKLTIFLVLALAVLILGALPASAAPRVLLDGAQLSFDVPPVIEQGRTLVPMRAIFEALGAEVGWDGTTRTVTAARGQTTVRLTIGVKTAHKNGAPVTLDAPAKVVNGRTLVPLRFVSEALGCSVQWDAKTQTVTITSASGGQVKVHFIDVGQGDSVYIQLPDRNDVLIDAGDNNKGSVVVSNLKSQGVDDIELLIASHPHADHIGGLDDVLAAFRVEAVVDDGMSADTATYWDYLAAVWAEGCPYQKATPGQSWEFGSCTLKVLGPVRGHGDVNNNSVVCLLDCGDVEFLFTGDAEAEAEADLIGKPIAAEILKVSHHGSRTSTSQAFLDAVRPEVAVICVGAGNRYGHPHQETLDKLGAARVKVYRTDLNGTVIITTDGRTYTAGAGR